MRKECPMRRILIVANQTAGGEHLQREIHRRVLDGPCAFHIVVPATRPTDHLVWTEGEAREIATRRLNHSMECLRGVGAEVTGEVGDSRPMQAISDAFISSDFDEIIVSTLPAGASRWLRQDLPARIARATGVPVTHVVAEASVARRSA